MKNLILGAALILGFAANAQTENVMPANTTNSPAATASVSATSPQQEKEYTKVQQSEIAPAVLKEAVAKYQGYELRQALKAQDGTDYKLVLTKDGKDVAAYFKSTGEFIKEVAV